MKYFQYFTDAVYELYGENLTLKDISTLGVVDEKIKDDILYYNYYTVLDGETPDNVSYRLYGTPDYYWTIFLMNPKLQNFYKDWYKSSSVMQQYLRETYSNYAVEFDASIAGDFEIGETIVSTFNAGVIAKIVDIDNINYKLLVTDVTDNGVEVTQDYDFTGIFPAGSGARGVTSNGFGVSTGFYTQYDSTYKHTGTDAYSHGSAVNPEFSINRITIAEVQRDINDDMGQIVVIKPEHIEAVISDFINKIGDV